MGARLRTSRVHLGQLVSKIWRGSVRIVTSHIAVYTSDAEQVTGRNRACGLTFLGVHNRTIHSPRISPSLRHLARGFLPFESAHTKTYMHVIPGSHVGKTFTRVRQVYAQKSPRSQRIAWGGQRNMHTALSALKREVGYIETGSARCLHFRYYWIALRLCTLHLTNLWLFQLLHYKLSEKYL